MQNVQPKKRKPQSYKAGNTTGISWSITNNTGAALVAINAFSDDQSVAQLYEQSLRVLQTTGGNKAIAVGSTATVNVKDARADSGGTYSMILARADNLFPVKLASFTADGDTEIYPSVTVTEADEIRMKLAAKFQKILTAFPSSSLAADFATALADSDPATTAAFFQANDDYKTLTIDDVVAVQTYYATYPFVWAYYGSEKMYGLHATDGTTNSYVGYITLQNKCTVPLDADKSIPGFTVTYTNGDVSRPLYYSAGQFVDDVNSASPAICLQGLFVLKSSITKSGDDQTLVAVLVGIIDGQSVLGYDEEQDLQNDGQLKDVMSSLDILVHPDDTKGWLELAGVIVATVLGFGVLCVAVKAVLDQATKVTPLTPEQTQDKIREITQRNLDRISDIKGMPDNRRLKIPEDVNASLKGIREKGDLLLIEENRTKMRDIVRRQGEILNELGSGGAPNSLELIGDDMVDMNIKLEAKPEDLGPLIGNYKTQLDSITDQLNAYAQEIWSNLEADSKRIINESNEAIKEVTGQVEEMEKMREDLAENRSPEERKLEELFETF